MEKLVNGEATPVVKEFVTREYGGPCQWRSHSVTPQCYGCTKTLASHDHVHHLIHKHHTMMNVIISCVFLFELLGASICVCSCVVYANVCQMSS